MIIDSILEPMTVQTTKLVQNGCRKLVSSTKSGEIERKIDKHDLR